MRRKREGWLGFFAFLFLWVKGCCCSRAPQKKRQASQEAKAACLFISLSRFCWRNETKAKRKKRVGWFGLIDLGGLRAAAAAIAPHKGSEPNTKPTKAKWEWNEREDNFLSFIEWNVFGPTAGEERQLNTFLFICLLAVMGAEKQREKKVIELRKQLGLLASGLAALQSFHFIN